jgi:SPP1 gp7 family putative phage head morphogenesis protein
MPTLPELSRRQKAAIAKIDAENLERVSSAYKLMYERLSGDVEALRLAIEALENPTQAAIKQLAQYKDLQYRAGKELKRFTAYLETVIDRASFEAIQAGLKDSAALVAASGVVAQVKGIAPNAMREALKYLDPNGKLYERLQALTGNTVDRVSQAILEGIGSGQNPRKIASLIQDAFGGGLTDALRWTRTTQLYSYRDSARANYIASGVVDKWEWVAQLDESTCLSCIEQNGSLHDLDEQMDSHFNCRCVAVPYIEGITEQGQSGEAWFNAQTEAEQEAIMGSGYYSAYKEGLFSFGDLTKQTENEVFGKMNAVTPLKELLGVD